MNSHLIRYSVWALGLIMGIFACSDPKEMKTRKDKHPKEILGNPNYPAISYGGYRGLNRDTQPTLHEIKEDLLIMYATGFRILRTYNVHFPHAENTLRAIDVPILSPVECRTSVRWLTDRMLCSGYTERVLDTCKGDSGGPLACYNKGKFYLGGIVSHGKRCSRARSPNIYTNVKYLKPWITHITKTY